MNYLGDGGQTIKGSGQVILFEQFTDLLIDNHQQ
jgi:hypothetical protein